ncbi:MAG: quercetin 2,3-dioxygenase [Opitutae bacterium]|nr:quercetin 2,3-dioxygenase [Opitutae bacterium]|tara:strand:+ start:5243 stop:5950 length:708 start_codon:yes stop_codon:yes gene_type:complete
MKFKIRHASERGKLVSGWLHARFTFSFSDYHDPSHSGFRSIKVINNDLIEPGGGFASHPHSDMEIFTYVLKGSLEHKDSMGNGSILSEGQLQYMSAGKGILHSEFNPSKKKQTELYQIWLEPNQQGGPPLYKEVDVSSRMPSEDLKILFSGNGRDDSTVIRQNAEFSLGKLNAGGFLGLKPNPMFPFGWIQVVKGSLQAGKHQLNKADGLAVENWTAELKIKARDNSEFLLFHLQ